MARAGTAGMCVALWITALILSSIMDGSSGEQAVDCCLKVSHHPIPKKIVTCYREQIRGNGCNIDAIVFRTWKGRNLCAAPEAKWVGEVMEAVHALPKKKKTICQKLGY